MIIRFEGRLGNQLFQYAFAYALSQQYPGMDVKFDKNNLEKGFFQLDKAFCIELPFCSLQESLSQKLKMEKDIITDKNYIDSSINEESYFYGFWQSENYFSKYKAELIRTLHFNKVDDFRNRHFINKIKNNYAVSIHVRRTDYFNPENKNYYIDLSSTNYYKNAITLIQSEHPDVVFFVFSDNIRECKKIFKGSNFIFVNCNSRHPWKDMYLMTLCDSNIVANSSFSWWGAYLNPRNEAIAPLDSKSSFARDYPFYYPESWKKVEI